MEELSEDEQVQKPLLASSATNNQMHLLNLLSNSVIPAGEASFPAQVSRSRSSSLDRKAILEALTAKEDLSADLISAVRSGDISKILKILADTSKEVDTDVDGFTPFLVACHSFRTNQNVEVIHAFLNRGDNIRINFTSPLGLTPLRALGFDNEELISALIDRGAHVLTILQDSDRPTIFDDLNLKALDEAKHDRLLRLLNQALDVQSFHLSQASQASELTRSETHATITSASTQASNDVARLFAAIEAGNTAETSQLLLEIKPSEIDIPNISGFTPFMCACRHTCLTNTTEIVRLFLQRQDINSKQKTEQNLTPLRALGLEHPEILGILTARGAEALVIMDHTHPTIFDLFNHEWNDQTTPRTTLIESMRFLLQAEDVKKLLAESPNAPMALKIISTRALEAEAAGNCTQKLINEIRRGTASKLIQTLLTHSVDLLTPCLDRPWTAFDYASALGRADITELLEARKRDKSPELIKLIPVDANFNQICELLSNKIWEVDSPDERGWTPFLHACARCDSYLGSTIVEKFLKYRKDLNINVSAEGMTPLRAARFTFPEILSRLIKWGAHALIRSKNSTTIFDDLERSALSDPDKLAIRTILMQAQDVKDLLISHPTSPEAIKLLGPSAVSAEMKGNKEQRFINAIRRGRDYEHIRSLITPGLNINAPCGERIGWNAFLYAIVNGKLEIIRLLIEQGCTIEAEVRGVNCADEPGALEAIENKRKESIPQKAVEDTGRESVFFEFSTLSIEQLTSDKNIKQLLASYLRLNDYACKGYYASFKAEWESYLSHSPLFVNARFEDQATFLHAASRNNKLPIAQYLIEILHASIDLQDSRMMTPLAEAIAKGNKDLATYLISQGASYEKALIGLREKADRNRLLNLSQLRTAEARAALAGEDTPESRDRNALLTSLEQALLVDPPQYPLIAALTECFDVNTPLPTTQEYLLHHAIRMLDIKLLRILAKKKEFNPNLPTNQDLTPLHLLFAVAASHDYTDYKRKLVHQALGVLLRFKRKLDLQALDRWGRTALDRALVQDLELAKLLLQLAPPITEMTIKLAQKNAPELYQSFLKILYQNKTCVGCFTKKSDTVCSSCNSVYHCNPLCVTAAAWLEAHSAGCKGVSAAVPASEDNRAAVSL